MVMLFLCGLFCAAAGGLLSGDHRQHADGRQPSGFVSRARQEQPAVGPHPRRPGALPPEARAGHGGQRSAIYWLFDQFGLAILQSFLYRQHSVILSGIYYYSYTEANISVRNKHWLSLWTYQEKLGLFVVGLFCGQKCFVHKTNQQKCL